MLKRGVRTLIAEIENKNWNTKVEMEEPHGIKSLVSQIIYTPTLHSTQTRVYTKREKKEKEERGRRRKREERKESLESSFNSRRSLEKRGINSNPSCICVCIVRVLGCFSF